MKYLENILSIVIGIIAIIQGANIENVPFLMPFTLGWFVGQNIWFLVNKIKDA